MEVNSANHDDDEEVGESRDPSPAGSTETADPDTSARPLVGAGMTDRCVSCDAPLASDQRYCLNCGERRGKSRLPVPGTVAPDVPTAAPTSERRREANRRRLSSGATLVAGIATLLLALGVGVEIGRTDKGSSSTPARASAPPVQVVTVGGSGGTGAAGTTPSATAAPTQAKAAKASNNTSANKAVKVVVTKKLAAKATAAASKVLGASAKNLAPATIQQGQACSHGAGCQNGKFTGNFFSP
jgi:hypothetical protein